MEKKFFAIQSFKEIIDEAENFLKSLTRYNIPYDQSRWNEYINQMKKVEEARKSNQLENYLKTIAYPDLYHIMVELFQLGFIARNEDKLPESFKISRFKAMMKGNDFLLQETKDTNQARNIQFELVLAVWCTTCGYEIDQKDKIDIPLKLDNEHFLIECKRPFSNNRLQSNIKKAANQLGRSFSNYSNPYGFIAISFQRVVPEFLKGIYKVKNSQDANKCFANIEDKLINQYRYFWRKIIDIRIIGFIGYIVCPVYFVDENIPGIAQYIFGNNIVEKGYFRDSELAKAKEFINNFKKLEKF